MGKKAFIPFGSQYYRAPTPLPDQWEKDLEGIRDAGFNTIKIWAQWRWNNPKENVYDFQDLDRLMDLAHQYDLKVVINIIMDVAPAWFFKKYPESVMIQGDGRRLEPRTTGYRQIGGAPGPCYHHRLGGEIRRDFISELARRYKDHPALYIWDLWNEPELTCGIAREPNEEDMVCYCPDSIRAFKEWLRMKYPTIQDLNKAWNRNYQDWDELEVPRNSHTFNDMIDWRIFFAQTLTNELRMRVDAVKEQDGVHPVMVHTVPMPYFNMINACSDEYHLAELCDMFGNSLGSHPLAAAMSVSAAPGKKVINAEIHAMGGNTYNRPNIPTFEEFKKHIFVPLARGIKGFLFWQYRPETLGTESPAWGLTALDGGETEWMKYSKTINRVLQENADLVDRVKVLPSQIAIINGPKNQIFDWCVTHSIDRHYYSVLGSFMALYRRGYNVDVISTDQIDGESLARYKVVYYPFPYYMEERVAHSIREWVQKGGTFISEAFFGGIQGENGLHSTTMPGLGFDEVFGAREGMATTASTFMNAYGREWARENKDQNLLPMEVGEDMGFVRKGEEIPGYFFMEELIPLRGKVLARFQDGKAAIVKNRYGKGQAILIGTLLGYPYGRMVAPETGKLIAGLVHMGGAVPYMESGDPNVRVDLLKSDDGQYLLVLVKEDEKGSEVEITFRADIGDKSWAVNLMSREEFPIENSQGKIRCRIPLKPWGCEIFTLR